jgi:methyltransferase (TIGR00027 family)
METTKASDTAVYCAVQRAAHQVLDGNPKVLSDSLAVGLTPGSSINELQEAQDDHMQPMRQRTRSGIVLRSRFAEDQVAIAVSEGVQQYLILGAGLDTFAFRGAKTFNDLVVLEVDHPATQAFKRELVAKAGVETESRVKFCPVDFERTAVAEGLASSMLEMDRPVVVSWLGVTMYLTRAAIEETLNFVLSLPSPSRVVMTFFQPLASTPISAHPS